MPNAIVFRNLVHAEIYISNVKLAKMLLITIEPIFLFTSLLMSMYSIISNEYIYHRFAIDYNLVNETRASNCFDVSNETKDLQAKVESETSKLGLYLSLASFAPSMLTTALFGAWSDVVGRKPPLFISCFGMMMMIVCYIVVISLNLPVLFLLVGRLFSGLCGDFPTILSCCFAYIGDVSSHKSRTLRIAAAEASLSLGAIVGSLLSGIWVDAQGYGNPLWLIFAGMIFCLVYILFMLRESLELPQMSGFQKMRKLFSLDRFKMLWNFMNFDWIRTRLILSFMLCFFLTMSILMGIPQVLTLIELSLPFCFSNALAGTNALVTTATWTTTPVQWPCRTTGQIFSIIPAFTKSYASACIKSTSLCGFILLGLVKKNVNEFCIVAISTVSGIAFLSVTGFATVEWQLFLGMCLGLLQTLTVIICRSVTSRLAGPTEQGSVFALLACAESVSGIMSGLVFNGVFAKTVDTFQPTVFLIAIGMDLLIFLVFGCTYRTARHRLNSTVVGKYDHVDVNSSEEK